MMCLYRLPHGQYGYSGHVINLPQDVKCFANTLPTTLDVVLVRKEGGTGSHKDFRMHRSKILLALQWLQENNKYYSGITIDQTALALLPIDGELDGLSTIILPMDDESEFSNKIDEDDEYTFGTFVPMGPSKTTEQEVVRQSVTDCQITGQSNITTLSWPDIHNTPINEFTTEGYNIITCAFPVLFPTGSGDFSSPRIHKVTTGNYFKHLIMYKDGHFAKSPRFSFFALNTGMRWRALQARNIYVRQHPRDAQLSLQTKLNMCSSSGALYVKPSSGLMFFCP